MQTIAAVERRCVSAAELTYLDEMRSAPFAAYRWSRATGSTRTGHPAAGAAHYGVIAAEHVLYRVHDRRSSGMRRASRTPPSSSTLIHCGTCDHVCDL